MTNVNFISAILKDTNLTGATLKNINFTNSSVSEAIWTDFNKVPIKIDYNYDINDIISLVSTILNQWLSNNNFK